MSGNMCIRKILLVLVYYSSETKCTQNEENIYVRHVYLSEKPQSCVVVEKPDPFGRGWER
jgi:hypothetical protein